MFISLNLSLRPEVLSKIQTYSFKLFLEFLWVEVIISDLIHYGSLVNMIRSVRCLEWKLIISFALTLIILVHPATIFHWHRRSPLAFL